MKFRRCAAVAPLVLATMLMSEKGNEFLLAQFVADTCGAKGTLNNQAASPQRGRNIISPPRKGWVVAGIDQSSNGTALVLTRSIGTELSLA